MQFKIVIPVYKSELSYNEKISFKSILKFYEPSDISLAIPENLVVCDDLKDIEQQKFDESFFKSVMSYNKLMLSKSLYQRYVDFDFILIHQLDAFMFSKDLEYWCKQGYDYIGAPWLKSNNPLNSLLKSKKLKARQPIFFKVGNGGFSLRKVETFLKFYDKNESVISQYENHALYGIEDVFWSLIAPEYIEFKIPGYKEAARFCLDRKPKMGMRLTNGKLPFGCHGFEKSKTKSFWKRYIPDLK